MREVVNTAGHRPKKPVVAGAKRAKRGRVAQVPFAHERGAITCRLQQ